jgi:hypothetical protein
VVFGNIEKLISTYCQVIMLTSTNQLVKYFQEDKKWPRLQRRAINTTLKTDLLTELKILAARKNMRLNKMLEEAIQLLLEKYEKESE